MDKYRIKRHVCNNDEWFEVQKKLWFLPFWYNFNNVDGCESGFYKTYDDAIEAIKQHKSKCIISYIPFDTKKQLIKTLKDE